MNIFKYITIFILSINIKQVNSTNTYEPEPKSNIQHSEDGYIFTIETKTPPQYSFFVLVASLSNDNKTVCSDNWIKRNIDDKTFFTLNILFSEIESCKPKETVTTSLITQELDLTLTLYDNNAKTEFKRYNWRLYNYIDRSTMISTNIKMLANDIHMIDIDVNSTIRSDIKFCQDISCSTEHTGDFYHGQEIIISHYLISNLHKYLIPSKVWLITTTNSILDITHSIKVLDKSINKCVYKVQLSTCVNCKLFSMSMIQTSLNRLRRLNNENLLVTQKDINIYHNSTTESIDNKTIENKLEVSYIVIGILSALLIIIIVYLIYIIKKSNKKGIMPENNNNIKRINTSCTEDTIVAPLKTDVNINESTSLLDNHCPIAPPLKIDLNINENTSLLDNHSPLAPSAPRLTTSFLSSPKMRRSKSETDITSIDNSPKSNRNYFHRDTASEPSDSDDYQNNRFTDEIVISADKEVSDILNTN